MIWSILSSALKTRPRHRPPLSRFFIFMRTVAALRPPRLYSVLSTTIGSLPCMMTLPARISWASFMAWFVAGALGAKPLILAGCPGFP
jgi:hypothetical protein